MINSTLKNANILIVDDQQANIDVLTGLLDDEGYTNYKTTLDSRKCIELYEEFKPDLILLDLIMPHFNGFQVMMQLKVLIPPGEYFPILILTADVTPESKLKALSGGASDFLTKPFDLIEVDLRIKNLLKTRYLHQQSENQNQILEEKVKERTVQLQQTNIELIAAKEKAEEANRLKSGFISAMSHEIRTPLNIILGYCDILREIYSDPTNSELQRYFSYINANGNRLIDTVTKILDISRIEAGEFPITLQPISINQVVGITCSSLKLFADKKGLNLRINLPSEELNALADSYCLENSLINIINNAIKYSERGTVEVTARKDESFVELKIKDAGIGMSEKYQKHLYQTFSQETVGMSRPYEGVGLGLALTKKYMKCINAEIEIASKQGVGTTVTLRLPLAKR